MSDIGVAVLLYGLLKPVNKPLAQIFLVTRLMQTAVHAVNLLNFFLPFAAAKRRDIPDRLCASTVTVRDIALPQRPLLRRVDFRSLFTVSTLILGYLCLQVNFISQHPGHLAIYCRIGLFTGQLSVFFLMPQYETFFAEIMMLPVIIGELTFTFYLLIKGVRTPKQKQVIARQTTQAEGKK